MFSAEDTSSLIKKIVHINVMRLNLWDKPGGADPQASHRSGDFTPAVNISFDDTILTLTGFTMHTFQRKQIEYILNFMGKRRTKHILTMKLDGNFFFYWGY